MKRNAQWWFGFVTGTLLLLWTSAFFFILSYILPLGPGLLLLFASMGVLGLLILLMLLLSFFRKTRQFSFGLAIPLLILQTVSFKMIFDSWIVFVYLVGYVAIGIVGIIALTSKRRTNTPVASIG